MRVGDLDEAVQIRDRVEKVHKMIEAYLCGTPIQSHTYYEGEKFSIESLIDSHEIKQALLPLLVAERARLYFSLSTLGVEP